MRACLFCDAKFSDGARGSGPVTRQAYDPDLGRLWDVCPRCRRWSPVPIEARWEAMAEWEDRVRREGQPVLQSPELSLFRLGDSEVVRVGRPPLRDWGAWRYGTRMPVPRRHTSFFSRLLGALPAPPLEGYDPYGLAGPMGGVGGTSGAREWLASPFLEAAPSLTLAFASVPFTETCPSCAHPMPLHPWEFQAVSFRSIEGRIGVEADCAHCGDRVVVGLREARPALRLGLALLDSGPAAHAVGEAAGEALDRVGGRQVLVRGLAALGAPLGELAQTERVALGIALDQGAEAEALESEWREAEEVAAALDGALTHLPGFQEFRARVLGRNEF